MCISVLYFVCVAYGFDSQFPLRVLKEPRLSHDMRGSLIDNAQLTIDNSAA